MSAPGARECLAVIARGGNLFAPVRVTRPDHVPATGRGELDVDAGVEGCQRKILFRLRIDHQRKGGNLSEMRGQTTTGVSTPTGKNKIAAAIFALLLGGLGIHKFYLGRIGQGIVYLIFCWTLIPALVGFIEGIIYLTMSDQAFEAKYG